MQICIMENKEMDGGTIKDYACSNWGLKIDPKKEFTKLLLSSYSDKYMFFSFDVLLKTAKINCRRSKKSLTP